jgi:hypothetical protein
VLQKCHIGVTRRGERREQIAESRGEKRREKIKDRRKKRGGIIACCLRL